MDIIDDKGRLFGTVNIIDALVVLLVLAVVAAGAAFVLGTDDTTNSTNSAQGNQSNTTTVANTTVTLQITGVQPYVADAIPEGPIETNRIVAVSNKSVHPTEVVVKDQNGTLHERTHPRKRTVTLEVTLETTVKNDEPQFGGKPLEVGRQLTLDFGPVTVKGTVTNLPDRN